VRRLLRPRLLLQSGEARQSSDLVVAEVNEVVEIECRSQIFDDRDLETWSAQSTLQVELSLLDGIDSLATREDQLRRDSHLC
jgi:hypothetical protein